MGKWLQQMVEKSERGSKIVVLQHFSPTKGKKGFSWELGLSLLGASVELQFSVDKLGHLTLCDIIIYTFFLVCVCR